MWQLAGESARIMMATTSRQVPAVLVSATHSGAGKTTVTRALLAALAAQQLVVQPFKIGPDFIDPMYHAVLAGRPSINLDLWMMGEAGIRDAYDRWSADADIVVIEAMGALFDGADGGHEGSAAHIAAILGVPVVVVMDVWGMTRTAAALIDGIDGFDASVEVTGFVLNRVGSQGHQDLIESALGKSRRGRVVAALKADPALEVEERHLGLMTTHETPGILTDRLERIAQELDPAPFFTQPLVPAPSRSDRRQPRRARPKRARLAVARDAAFCFYYEESLAALGDAGFDLVDFSPIADVSLPDSTDAVYLGGGYPESFAAELSANGQLAEQLRDAAHDGMPIYGECGGFIYLGRSLTTFDGKEHQMGGVLPIDFVMDARHLSIRYVELKTNIGCLLGPTGTVVRGQEFHQSRIVASDIDTSLFEATTSDGQKFTDGYRQKGVVASYMHVYMARNSTVSAHFAEAALGWRL